MRKKLKIKTVRKKRNKFWMKKFQQKVYKM